MKTNDLKLIFLDIDGVLNNIDDGTSYLAFNPAIYGLSNANIDVLKYIIKKTNAKIVMSSSWRNHGLDYSYAYHGLLFKSPLAKFKSQMDKSDFYECDSAPHMKGFQKYFDILGFFYKYDIDLNSVPYVVLDDQINQQLEKFGEHFFLIDGNTGLTKDIAESIIVYLNKEIE